jgi:hypothetical protein
VAAPVAVGRGQRTVDPDVDRRAGQRRLGGRAADERLEVVRLRLDAEVAGLDAATSSTSSISA